MTADLETRVIGELSRARDAYVTLENIEDQKAKDELKAGQPQESKKHDDGARDWRNAVAGCDALIHEIEIQEEEHR